MNAKLLLIGLVSLAVLPSCMTPSSQLLRASAAKQQYIETHATVAQGASDDAGQYIARNTTNGRLTLQPSTEQTAYLTVR